MKKIGRFLVLILSAVTTLSSWSVYSGEGGAGGGNRPIAVYTSVLYNFSLQYDADLQLTEQEDGSVVICNAEKATGQVIETCIDSSDPSKPVSRIVFHATNSSVLKSHGLRKVAETRLWELRQIPASDVVSTRVAEFDAFAYVEPDQDGVFHAIYWIETPNHELLEIEVVAFDHAGGKDLIVPILRTLSYDHEPPTVSAFDIPAKMVVGGPALPRLRFQATDRLSGIETKAYAGFWFEPVIADSSSAFGFDNLETNQGRLIFNYRVIREKDDWYRIETQQPSFYRGRRAGKYVLEAFSIGDVARNQVQFFLPGSRQTETESAECAQERQKPLNERRYCSSTRVNGVRSEGTFGQSIATLTSIKVIFTEYSDVEGEDLTAPVLTEIKTMGDPVLRFEDGKPVSDFALRLKIADAQNPGSAPYRIFLRLQDMSSDFKGSATPYWLTLKAVPLAGGWFAASIDSWPFDFFRSSANPAPETDVFAPLSHGRGRFLVSSISVSDRAGNESIHSVGHGSREKVLTQPPFYTMQVSDGVQCTYNRPTQTSIPWLHLQIDTDDLWGNESVVLKKVKVNPRWEFDGQKLEGGVTVKIGLGQSPILGAGISLESIDGKEEYLLGASLEEIGSSPEEAGWYRLKFDRDDLLAMKSGRYRLRDLSVSNRLWEGDSLENGDGSRAMQEFDFVRR